MADLKDFIFYEDKKLNITIYCGDSFEILPLINKVDLVICDPPYGLNLGYDVYDDTEENWDKMFVKLIPELKRVSTMSVLPCCRMAKLPFIYSVAPPEWIICWYKGSCGYRAAIGFNDWEPLLVYGKNEGVQMHDYFFAKPDTSDRSYKEHPCPKPVTWAKWLLSRCMGKVKNGVVLDPFLGSGTTLVAAKELGVAGIGIEMSKRYCQIAVDRLQNAQEPML